MYKDKQFYTLIITPATSSRFYKIMLQHRHLRAISTVCLVGFALLALTSFWVFKQAGLLVNYHQIHSENLALRNAQSIALQKLQSRLASVEAESQQVRQMAQEIAMDRNEELKPDNNASTTTGIGGPNELGSFASELNHVSSNLQRLRDGLGAEKTRLAITPRGLPTLGPINSVYGTRRDPFGGGYEFHSGVDIGAPSGHPVHATADGTVAYAGYRGGYGNLIVLDHGRGIQTFYGHLSHIGVSVGDRVHRHDQVGRVGSSGRAKGSHVHYEVRVNNQPVNPRRSASNRQRR
jgi:murein DD-endopeptidase MepM/ murein hydrolase activator NlpD